MIGVRKAYFVQLILGIVINWTVKKTIHSDTLKMWQKVKKESSSIIN